MLNNTIFATLDKAPCIDSFNTIAYILEPIEKYLSFSDNNGFVNLYEADQRVFSELIYQAEFKDAYWGCKISRVLFDNKIVGYIIGRGECHNNETMHISNPTAFEDMIRYIQANYVFKNNNDYSEQIDMMRYLDDNALHFINNSIT